MAVVSIIMPCYNAADYLADCIDSIINQSFSDWELLVTDDFSTDSSMEILKSYEGKDDRIKVLKNTEKGIISALQMGYRISEGKYITRMDADDLMSKEKLELMVASLESDNQSIVVGEVKYFATGKELSEGYVKYADWLNGLIAKSTHYYNVYRECVVPSPCWMMDRQLFEKVGGFKGYGYPEDYDLVFRLYQYNIPIKGIRKVLHHWRDHGQRASRNDENYTDQAFVPIKVHYFKKLDWKGGKVVLWGAGQAGKAVARELQKQEVPFYWVTDNPKKIGKHIYDVKLLSVEELAQWNHLQVITAIRSRGFEQAFDDVKRSFSNQRHLFYRFH